MRAYRYGCRPPIEGGSLVRQQIRLAHDYANDLTAVERGRRTAQRALLSSVADVAALEASAHAADDAVGEAVRALKGARAAARGRADTAAMRETITRARLAKRDAMSALRDARRAQREDPAVSAERERINRLAHELVLSLRAHCGVYWGTYLLVEAAIDASAKLPLYDGAEPNDPRFDRWVGEGRIGVQLQGGLPVADMMSGDDTRLRLARPVASDAMEHASPHTDGRRRTRHETDRVLSIRVGSNPDRSPVWARFPVSLHRPLPVGSVIKAAAVRLERRGGREHWTLVFSVDDVLSPRVEECGAGAVGVDLGWRRLADGSLRVGSWHGSDGEHGEMVVDARTAGAIRKADELRSIRDRAFDVARVALVEWIAATMVPRWLADQTKALPQWRSAHRLARVAQWWAHHRFAGDSEAFASLEAWRYHDDHLWRWEAGQREVALLARREQYRRFAADLARRYSTLVVETYDIRQHARLPAPEAPAEGGVRDARSPRTQRVLCSPSEFREALINAFQARGGTVEKLGRRTANTTRDCHVCGVANAWDQAEELRHACEACGAEWDQDENAGRNILARREQPGDAPDTGVARSAEKQGGSKWSRAKAVKAERPPKAVDGGARRPLSNAAE